MGLFFGALVINGLNNVSFCQELRMTCSLLDEEETQFFLGE
jgi:hypothetical protein